jgi:flagellar L-ring protein FlgH
MRVMSIACLIAAMAGLGCSVQPREIAQEPAMSPVGAGLDPTRIAHVHPAEPVVRNTHSSSTWSPTGADLFRDARAMRVGDLVTVKISIKDKASIDNSSNRSRDSKTGLAATLGYDIGALGKVATGKATGDGSVNSGSSSTGRGGISRSESIELLVAAVVTGVLPNGNLIISGTQEVRVNFEVRLLSVAGIIRARDVATDNSISYDKIAEARIAYGGRGRITEVQQPAWGQQLFDLFTPY